MDKESELQSALNAARDDYNKLRGQYDWTCEILDLVREELSIAKDDVCACRTEAQLMREALMKCKTCALPIEVRYFVNLVLGRGKE